MFAWNFWKEMNSAVIFVSVMIIVSAYGSQPQKNKTTRCEYYNEDECKKNSSMCGWQIEECKPPDDEHKRNHCFATWRNKSGKFEVTKACWLDDTNCYDQFDCTSTKVKQGIHFCCCEGDLCNKDIKVNIIEEEITPGPIIDQPPGATHNKLLMTLISSLVPMVVVAALVIFIFYMWKRRQIILHEPIPDMEPPTDIETPTQGVRPVQLLEVKARGRFGRVWRAQMVDQIVAVKVFPLQDKQSWMHETEYFKLPLVGTHENILKFIAAEKRLQVPKCNGQILDLWLISEFHEKGSLYDYLKGHSLTWPELLKIARGLASGLAFIHEDILPTEISGHKPAVAHRDFKSKNVLIKNDLTACIADFGLALVFEPGASVGDTHGQVGTRRYMAPEVLEGAINFNRDAFLRIDMYACGLVLWELVARCTAPGPVGEYKLPFEEEVGQLPTLADLQHHVVTNRNRPLFKDHWLKHKGLNQVCETIEECWDHDPEARLSAGCVQERFNQLSYQDSDITIQQTVALLANQALPNKESSF